MKTEDENHNVVIVVPVYNDWESLVHLERELSSVQKDNSFKISRIIVVNDGSRSGLDLGTKFNIPITVLDLTTNMGHQRAISLGLSYLEEQDYDSDYIIVMDSDGEDRPIDLVKIIHKAKANNNKSIVFAKREKRSEGLFFRMFYRVYKWLFYILTLHKIDFGNFSCIPRPLLKRVVSVPEIWNHYSGGIIKSKIPYESIGTDRGNRYHGKSKMNFNNLILHGLSSISIYLDIVSVRLMLLSIFSIVFIVIGLGVLFAINLFTTIDIPRWSSLIALVLFNMLIIVIFTSFLILLLQLNQKNVCEVSTKNIL